jgi:hypothetical protein
MNLNYSRVEAIPPHPFIKVEEAACEGVVFYVEQAATKPMPRSRLTRRVKNVD